MNSRGFPKTSKGYNENGQVSRNIADNYYAESSRNYNTSREMQSGVFANEIKKKNEKKDIPVEYEVVVGYSGSKARTSSKRNLFGRESRDEYFRGSEVSTQENVEKIIEREIESVKEEIYSNVSEVLKEQGVKYDKALLELVTQINTALKKKQENFYALRLDTNHLQESVTKLANNFQVFSKENEEKLETLVNEMGNITGTKKSKAYGDYGVDLKNSFQGLNSSISVNLGNETSNSKLVNEVIYQLDALKRDVSESKMQIEQMSLKLSSKIKQPLEAPLNNSKAETFLKEDILACIDKKIKQERRSSKLQERMDNMEAKWLSLHDILQKQEDNIFGMNEQLKNTINNQMNPKIKKIENSIVDVYSKIDPLMFQNQIREGINREMADRLKDCKLLKVRSPTASQSSRINSITGMNSQRISSNETYLLDEQSYLMDSEGCYLTETINGSRVRVRIDENTLYLLGLKGIEISNCC